MIFLKYLPDYLKRPNFETEIYDYHKKYTVILNVYNLNVDTLLTFCDENKLELDGL